MAFVHLHVHSQYSLLDGTADVVELAKAAAAGGFTALALTDTANLYGAVAFAKASKNEGIKPVFGAELHVQPEGLDFDDGRREHGGHQLLALVEDEVGYHNLCQLITAGIFEGMRYKPRVDLKLLQKHRDGLIFLTGGAKGVVGRQLARPVSSEAAIEAAAIAFGVLADFLGPDQLFLELSDVGLPGDDHRNRVVRDLAARTGHRLVVTNAVHYLCAEDAAVHEVLHAIAAGASLSDGRRILCPTDQAWLKSEAEMRELFPDDGPALDLTAELAARCHFKFTFGTYHFPATTPPDVPLAGAPDPDTDANWRYFYLAFPPPRAFGLPVPATVADSTGFDVPQRPEGAGHLNGYFEWYGRNGLQLRLAHIPPEQHDAYRARLESELTMIERMGFPAYLLIVAEFINWSKDNGIPVGPGRGSAAGSLVAWAMRITDIDPIRYGLLFERFLNPDRVSMPDIDVDFCQDRREESIAHVREKYGSDRVSQIITYGTLKARAAVRDVARVLDLSFTEADRIAKLVPDTLGITLAQALEQEPRLVALRDGDPKVRRVLALALAIEGTSRQTGVHAAGVVIADQPLVSYAPLYRDEPGGGPVVQFDMKSAESIGLIKFDFLGLKTLDQLRDALLLVRANWGLDIDLALIPSDDDATYQMLHQGDALGVFQLESSGMRDLLTRLKPSSMDDMVALVALYRPGPLQSGMTDEFVDRKHGRKVVTYPLPTLEPYLRETYGTVIYQEQVMQIAQVMAGYSLGEADLLRRAMGKKDKVEMERQKSRFVEGACDRAIDSELATEVFDNLAKFAEYGFNKSHSAAYGWISYQTAWLKAHYRPEYMAALMTIEAANTDKVLEYVLDCRRAGIAVEPVCINRSNHAFTVPPGSQRPVVDGRRHDGIRFGLAAVKNVGDGSIEAIVAARAKNGGNFRSAFDFFEQVDWKRLNRRVVEGLIKAGAFDVFGHPRAALMEGIDQAISHGQRRAEERAAGQANLFGGLGGNAVADFRWPGVAEWPLSVRLAYEREVLGLYLSGHPMQAHARDVARFANGTLAEARRFAGAEEVRLMGLVVSTRTVKTRRGDKMAFVKLEDQESAVEVVFFAQAWARSQRAVESGEPILVTGQIEEAVEGDEAVKLKASSAEPLSEIRGRMTREVKLDVTLDEIKGERLCRLVAILQAERGACRTKIVVRAPGRFLSEWRLPQLSVEPSARMEEQVATLFGRLDAVVLS